MAVKNYEQKKRCDLICISKTRRIRNSCATLSSCFCMESCGQFIHDFSSFCTYWSRLL